LLRRTLASVAAVAVASAALAFGASAGAGAAPAPKDDADVVAGSYIVTLADGVSPSQRAAEHGRREGFVAKHVYETALHGYAADLSPAAASRLAKDPSVRSVVADRKVSIAGKPVKPTPTTGVDIAPTGVRRINGVTAGAVGVDVAVIDTGVGPNSELTIAGGINCLGIGSRSAYGDANGHGTHVAGTIAAKNDSNGVVGVAPGARIWAVRVLDAYGNGSWSSIICGIDWVTQNAGTIEVANMSLGGSASGPESTCLDGTDPLHDAICRSVGAGVTYAVAAGNSAADTKDFVPGSYDQVITVSALTDVDGTAAATALPTGWCWPGETDESFAEFSNFGSDVDLIAPGVCITSTKPNGGTQVMSGTSMATPHVTGAAARYLASHAGASPAAVQAALTSSGSIFFRGDDPDAVDEPMLDVAAALALPSA
jgi:subtilisin family serine protease